MKKLPDKQEKTGDRESSLVYREMRKDKRKNRIAIRNAFVKYLEENKKRPTYKELAEITGVSVRTVNRHLKEIDFSSLGGNSRKPLSEQIFDLFTIEI